MKKKILIVLSYVLVAALACGATLALVYSGTESSKLLDLEDLILTRFAGDPDQTAIEDAAADAMVQAMGDRWSYYIPASEYDDFADNSANAYVGIGVTVQATEDGTGLEVVAVQAGGPAAEAGMEQGRRGNLRNGDRPAQRRWHQPLYDPEADGNSRCLGQAAERACRPCDHPQL